MNLETNRLLTFEHFPRDPCVSAIRLAQQGFYFNGEDSEVTCFFCRFTHHDWNTDGVLYDISGLHHPGCTPESRATRGNIPFSFEIAHQRNPGRHDTLNLPEPNLPHPGDYINATAVSEETASHLGIHTNRPLNPDQAILHKRVTSFRNSPRHIRSRAEEMAEAGLYYIGMADCVKCFYCGGVLRSWEPTDDPLREHARWFPSCTCVQLNSAMNTN